SRPESPVLKGRVAGIGIVRQLEVRDSIVYVAAREDGLFIIDASDPEKPYILSHYDTVEFATGIDIYRNLALVGNRIHGLEIVDISDLKHPVHIKVLRTGEAQSVDAVDGYAYVGVWGQHELVVCDIRDPYKAKIAARMPLDGKGDGVCVRGGYCYVATGHHSRRIKDKYDVNDSAYGCGNGMEIYDIKNPEKPVLVSRVKVDRNFTEFNHMWTVTLSGRYAFLAHSYIGLFIIDISDPARPEFKARLDLPDDPENFRFASMGGVAVIDDYIYVAGTFSDMYVVEARGLAVRPAPNDMGRGGVAGSTEGSTGGPSGSFTGGPTGSFAGSSMVSSVSGLADGSQVSVKPLYNTIYTIPPENGKPGFTVYRPQGQVYAAAFREIEKNNGSGDEGGGIRLIYAACGSAGIHVLENGHSLKKICEYPTKGFAMDIKIVGDTAYVAESDAGMSVWKLAGDSGMELTGRYEAPGKSIRNVIIPGGARYAMLQAGSRWLHIVDISDPQKPLLVLADSPENGKGMISGKQQICDGLVDGRYSCCFWHISGIYWYDLFGGDKPVYSGYSQTKQKTLSLSNGFGFTGNKALLIHRGGYILLDHKYDGNPDEDEGAHYYVDGVKLAGKPCVSGNIMFVSNRLEGTVTILDISDIKASVCVTRFTVEGNPDIIVESGGLAAIPAGYQGLMLFRMDSIHRG
ncbi:MAG: hypothetical protein PHG48_08540, partial [Eubacteriales bacterium]|nr:hypothetical protein [Eubacteriales bacterium]